MNKPFSGNEAPAHNTISIVLQKVISSGFPFLKKEKNGGFFHDGVLHLTRHPRTFDISANELPIKGPHNAINAMAATLPKMK